MQKKWIFILEDEAHIQHLIKYNLEEAGYRVTAFESGEKLLQKCEYSVPDMFIIDIMLPGIDGLEVSRHLKENLQTKNLPIIILTAKSEEFDKVLGLKMGADDYVTKPFSVRELVARVEALFRRVTTVLSSESEIIRHGSITIDTSKHEVYKDNNLVEMPLKEFELLRLLILNKGKVLSREMLLEKIWGFDYYGETRTIDVHIRHLRQKIEDTDGKPEYIKAVRGIGYKFNDKKPKKR